MPLDRVVDSSVLDGAMTATANAIREKTGSTERISWSQEKGFSDAMGEVYEAGKKAEHKALWDIYLQDGNRTNFDNAFAGQGWTPDNLNPNHDIRPTNAYMIFRSLGFVKDGEVQDLAKHFEDLGIKLDFSNCTNMQYAFQIATARRIGKIDLSKCTSTSSLFAYSYIYEIDEIVFSDITHIDSGMFTDCGALKKVKFSGVITKSGLDMGDCKSLDKASITSIFNTFSSTADISATFSRTAIDKAFTSNEWDALRATRPNVTIMYAS